MTAAAAAPSLSDRLAFAVELVVRGLGLSLRTQRDKGALGLLAWTRLKRLVARFAALAAAVEARLLPAARRTSARTARRAGSASTATPETTTPEPPEASSIRLPGGYGWLLALAPELNTRIGRSQIENMLADPGLLALLAAAPQAGRILRPLCHMLRIELPPALRLPPRPRRRRSEPTGGAGAETAVGEPQSAQAGRPPWMTWPASPPLPGLEDEPSFPPPYPARTGPPDV